MCIVVGDGNLAVSQTSIFARMVAPGVQALAYEMTIGAPGETAMVLPLPVAAGLGERAVSFISLERYPDMFERLEVLFERPHGRTKGAGGDRAASLLEVHEVGAFTASYVPTFDDFDRLDPRFRMPPVVIDRMPIYGGYGFAVFQLRTGGDPKKIHPMAFTFPTSDPDRLFFPTVHLHDDTLTATAQFDHMLYAQASRNGHPGIFESGEVSRPADNDYEGLVKRGAPVRRRRLAGELPNRDTWTVAF